jgi:hypothetical protein
MWRVNQAPCGVQRQRNPLIIDNVGRRLRQGDVCTVRSLSPSILLENAREVELRDGALPWRYSGSASRCVGGGRVRVRAQNEFVTFARANCVDESGRLVGRGGLGIPRKHERIAIDTCYEGER